MLFEIFTNGVESWFTDGTRIEYAFESMGNSGFRRLPNWSRLRMLAALLTLAAPAMLRAAHRDGAKHLLTYSIDVEGGQSTLLVGQGATRSLSTRAGPATMGATRA